MVRLEDGGGEDGKGTIFEYRTAGSYKWAYSPGEGSTGTGRRAEWDEHRCDCGSTDPGGCSHAECAIAYAKGQLPAKGLEKWLNYVALVAAILLVIISGWWIILLLLVLIIGVALVSDMLTSPAQREPKPIREFAALHKTRGKLHRATQPKSETSPMKLRTKHQPRGKIHWTMEETVADLKEYLSAGTMMGFKATEINHYHKENFTPGIRL